MKAPTLAAGELPMCIVYEHRESSITRSLHQGEPLLLRIYDETAFPLLAVPLDSVQERAGKASERGLSVFGREETKPLMEFKQ